MLLNFLVALWAAIAVTIYWLDYVRGPQRFRIKKPSRSTTFFTKPPTYWRPLDRKPFNCEACLPVWLFAVFFHAAIYKCNHVAFIAVACTAGIVTPMLLKQIRK